MPEIITDRIYEQLFPAPEETDQRKSRRQAIAAGILKYLPQLENLLRLQESNYQFRHALIEAILECVETNESPPKRRSRLWKELDDISKDAALAAKVQRRLISRLEQTSSIYPPVKNPFLERLANYTSDYVALSELARAHANYLGKDKGGVRGLIAFRILVVRLAFMFERFTGCEVSEAARYKGVKDGHQGVFFDFVQGVLPFIREFAPEMPLPESRLAEDTFVFDVVCSFRRTREPKHKKKRRSRRLTSANLRLRHR
jgi:hypothetical protein